MWKIIDDIRDDAVVQGTTWELVLNEDEVLFEDELQLLPEAGMMVWQSGSRWLCR